MGSLSYSKVRNIHLAAAVVATSIHILPRTLFIDHIKGLFQQKYHGMPMLGTQKIVELYNEVLDDMQMSDEVRQCFQPVFTPGSTLSHFGFSLPYLKCLICIPETFGFVGKKEVLLSASNKLNTDQISRDDFMLSKKAQKYVLAKEIYKSGHVGNYYLAILPALAVGHNFAWLHQIYTHFHKYLEYSQKYKRTIFGVIGFLSAFVYWFVRDTCIKVTDIKADGKVVELGKEYIDGYLEYKDKSLGRNTNIKSDFPLFFRVMLSKEG